jgi:membrane protease YdiL (CAAX protease family)
MNGQTSQSVPLILVGGITLMLMLAGCVADLVLLSAGRKRLKKQVAAGARQMAGARFSMPVLMRYTAALFLSFATGMVVLSLIYPLFPDIDPHAANIFIQGLTLHGAVIVLTLIYLRRHGSGVENCFGIRRHSLGKDILAGIFFLLASLPGIIIFSMLYRWLLHALGQSLEPQDILQQLMQEHYSLLTRICFFVLAVVVAPVAEEIVFRGVLFRLISRRFGLLVGMLFSALLFTLIHMHLASFMPIFVLAVALSFFYALTGSLLVPITMHALFNALGLLAFYAVKLSDGFLGLTGSDCSTGLQYFFG